MSQVPNAFDAPPQVRELIHAAVLALGGSDREAREAATAGALTLEHRGFGLACDADGDGLVASVDLGDGMLQTPHQRRLALRLNTELMPQAGAALALDRGRARLIARRSLEDRGSGSLATWLGGLARLATALCDAQRDDAATAAAVDTRRATH